MPSISFTKFSAVIAMICSSLLFSLQTQLAGSALEGAGPDFDFCSAI